MTNKQLMKDWPTNLREDGRMEIICPHGVGHPVKSLSRNWDEAWMGVHGCCSDGCCGLVIFALAELAHQQEMQRRKEYLRNKDMSHAPISSWDERQVTGEGKIRRRRKRA